MTKGTLRQMGAGQGSDVESRTVVNYRSQDLAVLALKHGKRYMRSPYLEPRQLTLITYSICRTEHAAQSRTHAVHAPGLPNVCMEL